MFCIIIILYFWHTFLSNRNKYRSNVFVPQIGLKLMLLFWRNNNFFRTKILRKAWNPWSSELWVSHTTSVLYKNRFGKNNAGNLIYSGKITKPIKPGYISLCVCLFVCLFRFYGISIFVGYLKPNAFLYKKKQFCLNQFIFA